MRNTPTFCRDKWKCPSYGMSVLRGFTILLVGAYKYAWSFTKGLISTFRSEVQFIIIKIDTYNGRSGGQENNHQNVTRCGIGGGSKVFSDTYLIDSYITWFKEQKI